MGSYQSWEKIIISINPVNLIVFSQVARNKPIQSSLKWRQRKSFWQAWEDGGGHVSSKQNDHIYRNFWKDPINLKAHS